MPAAAFLLALLAATPVLYQPGTISTGDYESHAAFTPDGKTLYFLKDAPDFSFWTVVVSHLRDGKWSAPEVVPWSGQYRDADPFITADGKRLYFISDRPVGGKAQDNLDIWYLERRGEAWSEPIHMDAPINSPGDEWHPTLASDGTLYFGSNREGGLGRTDLYRCRLVDGKYQPAENLGPNVNSKADEYEPLIAPDQSFLIFMAARQGGLGGGDLWISESVDGVWQPARNLGAPINSPAFEVGLKFSPDGKTLFYSSSRGVFTGKPFDKRMDTKDLLGVLRGPGNGLGDIYSVDVEALGLLRKTP